MGSTAENPLDVGLTREENDIPHPGADPDIGQGTQDCMDDVAGGECGRMGKDVLVEGLDSVQNSKLTHCIVEQTAVHTLKLSANSNERVLSHRPIEGSFNLRQCRHNINDDSDGLNQSSDEERWSRDRTRETSSSQIVPAASQSFLTRAMLSTSMSNLRSTPLLSSSALTSFTDGGRKKDPVSNEQDFREEASLLHPFPLSSASDLHYSSLDDDFIECEASSEGKEVEDASSVKSEGIADCSSMNCPISKPPSTISLSGDAFRTCFICLEGDQESSLLGCCTQCYAVVHKACWREWRVNQRLAAIRSRLLGQGQPNPSACSICKTGEDTWSSWVADGDPLHERLQDQLLQIIGRMLGEDGDDEEEPPMCNGIVTCLNIVFFVIIAVADVLLMKLTDLYPSDVVLLSVLIVYELMVAELLILALWQRRRALGPLLDSPGLGRDGAPDSRGVDELVAEEDGNDEDEDQGSGGGHDFDIEDDENASEADENNGSEVDSSDGEDGPIRPFIHCSRTKDLADTIDGRSGLGKPPRGHVRGSHDTASTNRSRPRGRGRSGEWRLQIDSRPLTSQVDVTMRAKAPGPTLSAPHDNLISSIVCATAGVRHHPQALMSIHSNVQQRTVVLGQGDSCSSRQQPWDGGMSMVQPVSSHPDGAGSRRQGLVMGLCRFSDRKENEVGCSLAAKTRSDCIPYHGRDGIRHGNSVSPVVVELMEVQQSHLSPVSSIAADDEGDALLKVGNKIGDTFGLNDSTNDCMTNVVSMAGIHHEALGRNERQQSHDPFTSPSTTIAEGSIDPDRPSLCNSESMYLSAQDRLREECAEEWSADDGTDSYPSRHRISISTKALSALPFSGRISHCRTIVDKASSADSSTTSSLTSIPTSSDSLHQQAQYSPRRHIPSHRQCHPDEHYQSARRESILLRMSSTMMSDDSNRRAGPGIRLSSPTPASKCPREFSNISTPKSAATTSGSSVRFP